MTGFFQQLINRFQGRALDLDELEEMLVEADFGLATTSSIISKLSADRSIQTAEDAVEAARREILGMFPATPPLPAPIADKTRIILLTGVNGTGKTTTAAKLAALLLSRRYSVLLAAADTFRAAAVEQLQVWGDRLGVPVHSGQDGADPAAVCHDALQRAMREKRQFLICDTAGRLHTRDNLMQQLGKISRSLKKLDPETPHEHWIVVDATTGVNAVVQAREFHAAIGLTGVIMTKFDGSGKGGALVAIAHETGLPTICLGRGERLQDLEPFDAEKFVAELL